MRCDCEIRCIGCGIIFAVEKDVKFNWHARGFHFYCPNGHEQWFTVDGESAEEKLKKAQETIEKGKKRIAELEAELEVWKPRVEKAS